MRPEETQLLLKKSINFSTLASSIEHEHHEDELSHDEFDSLGGIIYNGKLGWIANRSYLEVISLENGSKVSVYDFDRTFGTTGTIISCVKEVQIPNMATCIIAVGLQLRNEGGKVCLVSVQGSCIIGAVEVFDKVTTCNFIPKQNRNHSSRSLIRLLDGCLAIGTDQGKVILLDLCLTRCKHVLNGTLLSHENLKRTQCHVVFANLDPNEIVAHHQQSKREDIYFGIQLEVLENADYVTSILAIPFSLTLIVGLDDGRMILYDLEDLQAFHLAFPPQKRSPLQFLTYIEPADDPRACVYVWALHSSEAGAIGVMHSIMFERKYMNGDETTYQGFISCSARLTMPLYSPDESSIPVACHSITKVIDEEEEQLVTLCAIGWTSPLKKSYLMIFDLNQWYKEQMPDFGDWVTCPSYTIIFPLTEMMPLDVYVDENTIIPFNSIQRPEEHFYPNSLNFDVWILTDAAVINTNWPGLQSKLLNALTKAGSKAILEPNNLVRDMINAALSPQYQEFNLNFTMGIDLKREFLLSIALEYNCVSFLKQVALAIADGSHIGSLPTEALGLSTMTDWIWNRARALKEMTNAFCIPLFDYSGRTIDCGMQKSMTQCTKQLNIIADLMEMICMEFDRFIPEHVKSILLDQLQSIKLAANYQEITQWLLNVGLLPEGIWKSDSHLLSQPDEHLIVPYPYHLISSHYTTQRMKLSNRVTEVRGDILSPFIYIDMFMKNNCDLEAISNLWKDQGGNDIYPPRSLQKLLRTLLIPNMPLEAKLVLFVYLFLDINHVLSDGRYSIIVQNLIKFPAVFKMDPAIIKVTQSFWYLDHGDLETAIEELNSPICQERNLEQWQRDFLISTLLKQDAGNLALRILKSPGVPIDPFLQIDTLLANDLVSEAFKLQRAKGNTDLLKRFFEGVMKIKKRELLLDLSLNKTEAKILIDFLEKGDIPLSENLQFVYLLQRSDFVEAVSLIDTLMKTSQARNYNLDGSRQILSIYHTTLEPTTRQLTYLAYSNPDKFQLKKFRNEPKPLSSSLIRRHLDPAGGMYQRSVLSIKEAGGKEMFDEDQKIDSKLPFLKRSDLGSFSFGQRTQTSNVVYPIVINRNERKRQLDEEDKNNQKDIIQFNEYEGPRKRQKFDDVELPRKSFKDYDVSVLSRFNPTVKLDFNFTNNAEPIKFGADLERTPEKVSSTLQSTKLTTPVVQQAELDESPEAYRFTPHSILKSKASASGSITPLSYVSRKSFESEEKIIRFAIPNSKNSTLDSTMLENSYSTLNTTQDVTNLNESTTSREEFFSPDVSSDQTLKTQERLEQVISLLDKTRQQGDVIMGHENLTFLADAPQPRPPIRCSSDRLSHSRSVSPIDNRGSLEKSEQHEKPQEQSVNFDTDISISSINEEKSSTPLPGPVSVKRTQKSLSRMVIEANAIKQQIIADIFGEYSKSTTGNNSLLISQNSQSELKTTVEKSSEEPMNATDTDISNIGFLSYEESGVLTGDTLQDKEILKDMLGNQSLNSTTGHIFGDSTIALINDTDPVVSDSSNYEETRENLNISEIKEQSNIDPIEMKENKDEVLILTQNSSIALSTSTNSVVSNEHISIADDSIEINTSGSESTRESSESDDSYDKFANVSNNELEEDSEPEDYDLEEENEDELAEVKTVEGSIRESRTSEDETKAQADEVISLGSSSEDNHDDDDSNYYQQNEEIYIEQEIISEVEMSYADEPLNLNQGLILSHAETIHDTAQNVISNVQLYDTAYNVETHPSEPIVQPTDTKLSEMLYGDIEVDDYYDDNDSLNLAIVEENTSEQQVQDASDEVVQVVEEIKEESQQQTNVKIVEIIQNVPNHRVECVQEISIENIDVPVEENVTENIEKTDDSQITNLVHNFPNKSDEKNVNETYFKSETDNEKLENAEKMEELMETEPLIHPTNDELDKLTEVPETMVPFEELKQRNESNSEVPKKELLAVSEVFPQILSPETDTEAKKVELPQETSNDTEIDVDTKEIAKHESNQTESKSQESIAEIHVLTAINEKEQENIQNVSQKILIDTDSETISNLQSSTSKTPAAALSKSDVINEESTSETCQAFVPSDISEKSKVISHTYKHNETNFLETATKRTLRPRAISMDQKPSPLDSPLIKRSLRASSVPRSTEDLHKPSPRKLRKVSTDVQVVLEQIQEDSPLKTLTSTPTRRTRKQSSENASNSGHVVVTRSTSRRLSTEVLDVELTPQRLTRSSSKEQLSTPQKSRRIIDIIQKEPADKTESTLDVDRKSIQVEKKTQNLTAKTSSKVKQEEPSTSTEIRKTKRGRSRTTSVSETESSPTSPSKLKTLESYTETRRLTRKQKALLEKSLRTTSKNLSAVESEQQGVSSGDDSDESIVSTRSKKSTSSRKSTKTDSQPKSGRILRSSRVESNDQYETESVSSRGSKGRTRKRKGTKQEQLDVIPEEHSTEKGPTTSSSDDKESGTPVKRTRTATRKGVSS